MSPSSSKGTGSSVVMATRRALLMVNPSICLPLRICAPSLAQSVTRSGLASMRSTTPSSGEASGNRFIPAVMVPTLPSRAMTAERVSGSPSSSATVTAKGSGTALWTAATA